MRTRHGLDHAVLHALAGQPSHGYAVTRRLDARDLAEGTVYPVLHRLERLGLVCSAWADVDGRRRRVYQLTGEGAAAVEGPKATERAPWRLGPSLRWSA